MREKIRDGGVSSVGKGSVLRVAVVYLCFADEFEFLFEVSVRERLLDGLGLVEDAEIGEVSKRNDVLDAVGEADIVADFGVYFGRDSLVDDALDSHVLYDVLEGDVEGNHVLVVLDQLAVLLQQSLLLQHQLLVETDRLYVLLQSSYQI